MRLDHLLSRDLGACGGRGARTGASPGSSRGLSGGRTGGRTGARSPLTLVLLGAWGVPVLFLLLPACVRGVWWGGWGHAVGVWGCVPYCVLLLLLSWLFAAACLVVVWGVVGVWVGWL